MKLVKDRTAEGEQSQESICTDEDTIEAHCTETHAYVTPPLEIARAHLPHTLNFGIISETETYLNGESITDLSNDNAGTSKRILPIILSPPRDDKNMQEIINIAGEERKSSSEIIDEAAQFMYGHKSSTCEFEETSSPYAPRKPHIRHQNEQNKIDIDVAPAVQIHVADSQSPKAPRLIDHIYEEIGSSGGPAKNSKYDILDYYEKYSPTTAKMLIDTLFLPGYKICKICSTGRKSVVYSDRLIKYNEPLRARETTLLQTGNSLNFNYALNKFDSEFTNFIPVYTATKPNTSGIFYSSSYSTDVFDLKSTLEPTIQLLDSTFRGLANTEIYHRNASYFRSRIPENGFEPKTFNNDRNDPSVTAKNVGYETDLNNWINYRKDVIKLRGSKPNELPLSVIEPHPDRSSLLLLEPLLLMPEISKPRRKQAKNRITHSERLKIVRMMIAYTLAFFLLAIVTFYIIYFS